MRIEQRYAEEATYRAVTIGMLKTHYLTCLSIDMAVAVLIHFFMLLQAPVPSAIFGLISLLSMLPLRQVEAVFREIALFDDMDAGVYLFSILALPAQLALSQSPVSAIIAGSIMCPAGMFITAAIVRICFIWR